MNRKISLLLLVATVLLVAIFFFRVVEPFLFPVFFAAVMALLFAPVHTKLTSLSGGRRRLTAVVLTLTIFLIGLVPLSAALYFAGQELVDVAQELVASDEMSAEDAIKPVIAQVTSAARRYLDDEQIAELRRSTFSAFKDVSAQIFERTHALIANVIEFVVGLVIMLLSLYYFLADGPTILATLQSVSPFEGEDEEELFREFDRITRSVILATLVCAIIQAALAGVGFYVAGVERFWLLSGLTMLSAMIPFLGAAFVWACTAVALAISGDHATAIGLALYGGLIVSSSDNLLRAYIIHGTSDLHPLLALISVLGALQIVGLWGVFVGPTVAAFFYALLKILHRRMQSDGPLTAEAAGD